MNSNEKIILYCITIIIDIILLFAINNTKIKSFDFFYIISILFVHFIFYISLFYNNQSSLDFLHYFVFLYISLSVFCNNYFILLANIILLFFIQYLWLIKGRCILNSKNGKQFGYSKEISIYTLVISFIICIKFGNYIECFFN